MIDGQNPHYWYVRTFVRQESAVGGEQQSGSSSVASGPVATVREVEGWVEASMLQDLGVYSDGAHVGGGGARRSQREVFREEVLQIANKKQEASARRRCVISELLESERDYIAELAAVEATLAKLVGAHEKSGGGGAPPPPQVRKFLQAHLLPSVQKAGVFHKCAFPSFEIEKKKTRALSMKISLCLQQVLPGPASVYCGPDAGRRHVLQRGTRATWNSGLSSYLQFLFVFRIFSL